MNSFHNNFSHIYVEEDAMNHPFGCQIIDKFSSAKIIEIKSYRDIFLRNGQSFDLQKKTKKIILAIKKSGLIYKGSHFSQDSNSINFFYNTLSMNCLYDCSYCYLQGMYPSANIVCFLNLSDYFDATKVAIKSRPDPSLPLFLSLSYDTDLLAFENIAPYCRHWIGFAHENENFVGEIRTKSANFNSVSDLTPTKRILFAWTLSPEEVTARYERDTPSLKARISSAQQAVDKGWMIRLCFDPVIMVKGWRDLYKECVDNAFDCLPINRIFDATVGTFRMSASHLRVARKHRPRFELLQRDWLVRDGAATSSTKDQREVADFMRGAISKWLPEERIIVWS